MGFWAALLLALSHSGHASIHSVVQYTYGTEDRLHTHRYSAFVCFSSRDGLPPRQLAGIVASGS